MTTEEFGQVCKRVHQFLLDRCDKVKEKRDKHPTQRAHENYAEAAKDVFAVYHLMELVESMGEEISDLRTVVASMDDDEDGPETIYSVPEMFSVPKKHYKS